MIMVINLGLKSIRAIIYDDKGTPRASASRQVNSRLTEDFVEQDANEWRSKMYRVMSEAIDASGLEQAIEYITVSCSASCLLPVDHNLNPLSHVIMVSDKRAREQAAKISKSSQFKKITETKNYNISEYSQISRILWTKENKLDIYESTWKFLSPNDFLISILSGGKAVTDILNAEKCFYDPSLGAYPEELYEAFGLSCEKLPECLDIGTNIGKVDSTLCREVGILSRPDIIVGTYDAICSVFGTGVSAPGQVCDVSGTVTSVRMYSETPFQDPKTRIVCQHFPPSGGYLLGGSNNLGGGLIEWAKQCIYSNVPSPYEQMLSDTETQSASQNRSGLIFIPHLLGARAPTWNANARGVFFGLERHHDRGDIMRSIFESIAFSIRDFVEIFRESGTAPDMITASGGLAKLPVANEIKANITGLPYHFMTDFESTSLGAAIIVMCSQKHFESYKTACEHMASTKHIFLPSERDRSYYDDMYGLYSGLNLKMNPLFELRREIMDKHSVKGVEYVENL